MEAVSNGFYSVKTKNFYIEMRNFSIGDRVAMVLFKLPQVWIRLFSGMETNPKLPGSETRLSTHIDRILSYTSFPG